MSTSRELVEDLIRGRKAERVALTDWFWPETLAAWVEQGYPTREVRKEAGERRWRRQDGMWQNAQEPGDYEEPVPPWKHFGFDTDLDTIVLWFDLMPLRGYREVVEETEAWEVRRNGAGAALKFWKHKSGTPEHMDFRMVTRQIWERDYRSHVLNLDPQRIDVKGMRKHFGELTAGELWTHYDINFVWELMRSSMGDVTLYMSLLDDPAWIHDYNRVYTDFYKAHFAYIFEHVGLPDGIMLSDDIGYNRGLFASPKVLGELIFPYHKEMVDFFHSYDLPVALHTCGSIAQALPLIIGAGYVGLNPIERKAKNNDPFAFAETYGDRLVFIGGLDTRVLETNDKDIIRREVVDYVVGMKARGARLVFGSDHSVSPTTRYDSYCYALDVFREHMAY